MRLSHILVTVLILGGLILSAGCTQAPPAPAPTTTVTTRPTTVPVTMVPTTTAPATTAPSLTPGPIDSVPDMYQVEAQVTRNTVSITPNITVTFRGGKGINFLKYLDVKVTRSDGVTQTGRLTKPKVDDFVELEGTRGTDRVEVWVLMENGQQYKIYDEALPFRAFH